MKRFLIILLVFISMFIMTACNKTGTIKTYDDIDYIEKPEDNDTTDDEFESLDYVFLDDSEISVMFSKTEDENGDFVLYLVGTTYVDDKILWEYKTSPYDMATLEVGKYIFDPNYSERVYLFENNSVTLLDMTTGKVIWKNNDFEFGVNSGVVLGSSLYLKHPWDTTISVINKNDGKPVKEIIIPEEYMYESYDIIGSLNNYVVVRCVAEKDVYLSVDINTDKIAVINLYLNK